MHEWIEAVNVMIAVPAYIPKALVGPIDRGFRSVDIFNMFSPNAPVPQEAINCAVCFQEL